MTKNFLSLADFSKQELLDILILAKKLKNNLVNNLLQGKQLAMIFEKTSTRTRVSFEVGINQLGGQAIFLDNKSSQLGKGETIADTARVLSRYVDIIMIRANYHKDIEELAKFATVPVINGLSDFNHPCQIMADLLTISEKKAKNFEDLLISWIGDGNNMLNSYLNACLVLGFKMQLALHKDYYPNKILIAKAQEKNLITIYDNSFAAAKDADVVMADTFISMGDENQEQKSADFKDFIVTSQIIKNAQKDAIFMHCLPAYRGQEVTEEVLESENSVIFDQAENRLHIQKAIMITLLKNK